MKRFWQTIYTECVAVPDTNYFELMYRLRIELAAEPNRRAICQHVLLPDLVFGFFVGEAGRPGNRVVVILLSAARNFSPSLILFVFQPCQQLREVPRTVLHDAVVNELVTIVMRTAAEIIVLRFILQIDNPLAG
jgi:hypothetical protein